MDDLISREQATQKMVDLFQEDVEMYGAEIPECFDSDRAEEALRELPSIDAVPVKHGRWKYISFLTVECSECKTQIHDLEYSNFCPNCGAKMDGEENG